MSAEPHELPTRIAHWGWNDHRFLGHAAFGDLISRETFTGLLALATTQRRVGAETVALLDEIAGALTLADPRIWPLKLSRLVSAYGAVAPGVAVGMLIAEDAQVGAATCGPAATWLRDLCARLGAAIDDPDAVQRAVDERLASHRFLWGFGAPCRPRDERLEALRACVAQRGHDQRPYWRAMESVARAVRVRRDLAPNVVSGIAASCLDAGLAPDEIGRLVATLVQHCFVANATESAAQASEVLHRLPEHRVTYAGRAARASPRATHAKGAPARSGFMAPMTTTA